MFCVVGLRMSMRSWVSGWFRMFYARFTDEAINDLVRFLGGADGTASGSVITLTIDFNDILVRTHFLTIAPNLNYRTFYSTSSCPTLASGQTLERKTKN